MKRTVIAAAAVVSLAGTALGVSQAAARERDPNRDKIASAQTAAPDAIAGDAAVLDWPEAEGQPYPVLREGTNGWSCFPDFAGSPGDDPQCYDRYGMEWLDAYYAGAEPKLAGPGLIYRLAGGSDPSLSDPYATEPGPGEEWTEHGPHIVILPSGKLDPSAYGADHHGGGTWVMWPGTPYEHLHVPVR